MSDFAIGSAFTDSPSDHSYHSLGDTTEDSKRGLRLEALANLAHELRSPMQAVLGYLDILGDELTASLSDRQRHLFERMNVNAQDLAQTVENVMEFATEKLHERALSEEINLGNLLAEMAPALDAANSGKGLALTFNVEKAPEFIRSNRRAIKSILMNLALNAIKFTEHGGVTIAISKKARTGLKPIIELLVSDTGKGIDAALIAKAFEPCSQLSKASTRSYRGVGLGLTVVEHHALALGATVTVKSVPNQGSTFVVAIPLDVGAGAK